MNPEASNINRNKIAAKRALNMAELAKIEISSEQECEYVVRRLSSGNSFGSQSDQLIFAGVFTFEQLSKHFMRCSFPCSRFVRSLGPKK
jgi:hypothetical protein